MGKTSKKPSFHTFFLLLSLAFALAVLIRYASLMLFPDSDTAKYENPEVSSQYFRGTIYDRNGEILATNKTFYRLIADPGLISDKENAALALAAATGVGYDTVLAKISRDSAYSIIIRKMSEEEKLDCETRIREAGFNSRQVYTEPYTGRFYPESFCAAQIIGFTDPDSNGLEGIEYTLDEYLSADPVIGKDVSFGDNVYLTLDIALQCAADSIIDGICENPETDYAVLILMDAQTGEILASVSRPRYDLNFYASSTSDQKQNKAFAYAAEPGSLYRIYSLAAIIEAGESALEPYECTGNSTFTTEGGQKLTVFCDEAHGLVDAKGALDKSCAAAIASWALETSDELFFRTLDALGFGKRYSEFDMYNAAGILPPPSDWSFTSKAALSLGRGISATALQLTGAATALANGGTLILPSVVKRIEDSDGNTVYCAQRTETGTAISKETAQKVLDAMCGYGAEVAIATGSGGNCGTAIMIFPYEEPKYIAYIATSAPDGNSDEKLRDAIGGLLKTLTGAPEPD